MRPSRKPSVIVRMSFASAALVHLIAISPDPRAESISQVMEERAVRAKEALSSPSLDQGCVQLQPCQAVNPFVSPGMTTEDARAAAAKLIAAIVFSLRRERSAEQHLTAVPIAKARDNTLHPSLGGEGPILIVILL